MSRDFYAAYLRDENAAHRMALYVMNPYKFMATQLLINYHEAQGDKILVFSDTIFALVQFATILGKPMIHGKVGARASLPPLLLCCRLGRGGGGALPIW